MTSAEQYQYERGRLDEYRATMYQRMACATGAARKAILEEGDALLARLEQLGDQVRREGEAARNAASPSPERRYDASICEVRCAVFPAALWSLVPPATPAHVGELHRIEQRWAQAQAPGERALVAADAEGLAHRIRNNSLLDFKLPGAQLDELHTTNAIIEQLNRDIVASNVGAAFKAGWRAFRDEWQQFYQEHQGWTDRLWYSTYEKTVEYRQRAADWRTDFETRGGRATGPKDTPPEPAGKGPIPWGKVALGAGVAVGALAALNLLAGRR